MASNAARRPSTPSILIGATTNLGRLAVAGIDVTTIRRQDRRFARTIRFTSANGLSVLDHEHTENKPFLRATLSG